MACCKRNCSNICNTNCSNTCCCNRCLDLYYSIIYPREPIMPEPASTNNILLSNLATQTVQANNNLALGNVVASNGRSITYNSPTTVLLTPGTYYVTANVIGYNPPTSTGEVGVSIDVNGTPVPTASQYIPATTTQSLLSVQSIVTVPTGNTYTLTLNNGSTDATDYVDSSLTVIKLS